MAYFRNTYAVDKGLNPWGWGGGDNMSFILPCFDPQICCSLYWKINNVL